MPTETERDQQLLREVLQILAATQLNTDKYPDGEDHLSETPTRWRPEHVRAARRILEGLVEYRAPTIVRDCIFQPDIDPKQEFIVGTKTTQLPCGHDIPGWFSAPVTLKCPTCGTSHDIPAGVAVSPA